VLSIMEEENGGGTLVLFSFDSPNTYLCLLFSEIEIVRLMTHTHGPEIWSDLLSSTSGGQRTAAHAMPSRSSPQPPCGPPTSLYKAPRSCMIVTRGLGGLCSAQLSAVTILFPSSLPFSLGCGKTSLGDFAVIVTLTATLFDVIRRDRHSLLLPDVHYTLDSVDSFCTIESTDL
jgi:hypothetical protein